MAPNSALWKRLHDFRGLGYVVASKDSDSSGGKARLPNVYALWSQDPLAMFRTLDLDLYVGQQEEFVRTQFERPTANLGEHGYRTVTEAGVLRTYWALIHTPRLETSAGKSKKANDRRMWRWFGGSQRAKCGGEQKQVIIKEIVWCAGNGKTWEKRKLTSPFASFSQIADQPTSTGATHELYPLAYVLQRLRAVCPFCWQGTIWPPCIMPVMKVEFT